MFDFLDKNFDFKRKNIITAKKHCHYVTPILKLVKVWSEAQPNPLAQACN